MPINKLVQDKRFAYVVLHRAITHLLEREARGHTENRDHASAVGGGGK